MLAYIVPILALLYFLWIILLKIKERIDDLYKENAHLKERLVFTENILHKIVSIGTVSSNTRW